MRIEVHATAADCNHPMGSNTLYGSERAALVILHLLSTGRLAEDRDEVVYVILPIVLDSFGSYRYVDRINHALSNMNNSTRIQSCVVEGETTALGVCPSVGLGPLVCD